MKKCIENVIGAEIGVPQPNALLTVLIDEMPDVTERLFVLRALLSPHGFILNEAQLGEKAIRLLTINPAIRPLTAGTGRGLPDEIFDRPIRQPYADLLLDTVLVAHVKDAWFRVHHAQSHSNRRDEAHISRRAKQDAMPVIPNGAAV